MPNTLPMMMAAAGGGEAATAGLLFRASSNESGELGNGTIDPSEGGSLNADPPFIQIGSDTDWEFSNASGYGTRTSGVCYSIKTDGSLFLWGSAANGKLGNGTTTPNICSPVQLGAAEWATAGGGYYFSFGVKTDGTLWTWGKNGEGQLGLGNTTNTSSPIQVGSLTDWSTTIVPVAGYQCMSAIKQDGTLWAWGSGGYGQLGVGNESNYSSPIQVGSDTDWIAQSRNLGPGSAGFMGMRGTSEVNGALWACGSGSQGQLGLGDTANKSDLTQVGALTTWKTISFGYQGCAAVKYDGTAWSWGGSYGGLNGDGSTTSRSSPVQIGALTDWTQWVKASNFSTLGIRSPSDGNVWMAGNYARICGEPTHWEGRSSPVAFNTAGATWIDITSSYGTTSFGLRGTGPVCP